VCVCVCVCVCTRSHALSVFTLSLITMCLVEAIVLLRPADLCRFYAVTVVPVRVSCAGTHGKHRRSPVHTHSYAYAHACSGAAQPHAAHTDAQALAHTLAHTFTLARSLVQLLILRFFQYHRVKYHYFMLDFCYFVQVCVCVFALPCVWCWMMIMRACAPQHTRTRTARTLSAGAFVHAALARKHTHTAQFTLLYFLYADSTNSNVFEMLFCVRFVSVCVNCVCALYSRTVLRVRLCLCLVCVCTTLPRSLPPTLTLVLTVALFSPQGPTPFPPSLTHSVTHSLIHAATARSPARSFCGGTVSCFTTSTK